MTSVRSTGLLDWFEVDLRFPELALFRFVVRYMYTYSNE